MSEFSLKGYLGDHHSTHANGKLKEGEAEVVAKLANNDFCFERM